MLNLDKEKLALLSWLYKNDQRSYQNTRKVQKFLFFYEIFSKIVGESYELGNFKIWLHGPVDSYVYGDYTYRQPELIRAIESNKTHESVQEEIAKKADFLVQILNTEEISNLTHEFDLWKTPAASFEHYEQKNISLNEKHFSHTDELMAEELFAMYDEKMIENSTVIHTFGKHFVLTNDDANNLTEDQQSILDGLSFDENLQNPVFVEIDEDGALIID
ncbi:hypothetical protein [Leuconostoc mesenteroides]|uniref:hypothetical protein n=1 Tax=Leuconostoc mesenteroides TaxID=1245 RepID=UPI00236255B1|nr:hypothetical protein [Leuconostoc mesenteroides]